MVTVEDHNCSDIVEEEFDMKLFHFWDFPMESVGVDDFVGDWDDSKSECLGPIPFETLIPPNLHRGKFNHPSTIDESHDSKKLPCILANSSNSQILDQTISTENRELASFQTQSPVSALESTGSCSAGIFGPFPTQPRSKSFKQRPRNKPWNVLSPWHVPESLFRKIPDTKKNKVNQQSELFLHNAMTKMCSHCKITKTPQWREGPMGPKTLCNACGVRYRSGRLFPEYRPAASPTFISNLHSNSHKKVLEMRNQTRTPHKSNFEETLIF